LEDIFENVVYITPGSAMKAVITAVKTTPADVAALVAELWASSDAFLWSIMESPILLVDNLAAACKLGPAAHVKYTEILQQVVAACEKGHLIMDFGELCNAAIKQANLDGAAHSVVGKQICKNLRANLNAALLDLFQEQLDLLQLAQ
jgi:hypothetical protein